MTLSKTTSLALIIACFTVSDASAQRSVVPLSDEAGLMHTPPFTWFGREDEFSAGLAIADFDGDGDNDIASVNGRHWPVADEILFNNGNGRFFESETMGKRRTTGYGACAGDVEGDGDIDLLVARDGLPGVIYLNNGAGTLTDEVAIGPAGAARDCLLTDLNADGELDAVLGDRGGNTTLTYGPLLRDNTSQTLFSGPVIGLTAGDLNGDARPDLVLSLRGEATLAILINQGADGFGDPIMLGSEELQSRSTALGDWDGDGQIDIAAAILNGANRVFLNKGGDFSNIILIGTPDESSAAIALTDLDNNGKLDAVIGNDGKNAVVMNRAVGPEWIELPEEPGDTYDLAVGDLTGEGSPDIVFANSDAPNTIYFTTGLPRSN